MHIGVLEGRAGVPVPPFLPKIKLFFNVKLLLKCINFTNITQAHPIPFSKAGSATGYSSCIPYLEPCELTKCLPHEDSSVLLQFVVAEVELMQAEILLCQKKRIVE